MKNRHSRVWIALIFFPAISFAAPIQLDERPAGPSDWGYRPEDGASSATNPPSFSWRPQSKISRWEVRCLQSDGDKGTDYQHDGIRWNVHCPSRLFTPGEYRWQYRGLDSQGQHTNWSRERTFTIPEDAAAMAMPDMRKLLARIPEAHPRLFVRLEHLPHLRELAKGELKPHYESLVAACEKLLKNPPPTETQLEPIPGGYLLTVKLNEGWATMLLPSDDSVELSTTGLKTKGRLAVARCAEDCVVNRDAYRENSNADNRWNLWSTDEDAGKK
jgi:hypothetical protein